MVFIELDSGLINDLIVIHPATSSHSPLTTSTIVDYLLFLVSETLYDYRNTDM